VFFNVNQANTSDHYGARLAEKLSDNGGFKVSVFSNFLSFVAYQEAK
jgi:hypothetical protein